MDLKLNQRVELKKQHPCGSVRWLVLRTGADFRLRCAVCGREVMGPRSKFERNVKGIERPENS